MQQAQTRKIPIRGRTLDRLWCGRRVLEPFTRDNKFSEDRRVVDEVVRQGSWGDVWIFAEKRTPARKG